MTSLSPRGSVSMGIANVAEDFEESLRDLNQNNRYEISNLTLIAKESTEHAQAISKALETHIRTTAPNRKLPALYVLDSIVKNVGTPYTVYLGRNLYSTFMDAYTLVDGATRRSMEGMLRTWKEPVPNSLDPRPVFPPETVRTIESALLKAKTAVLQSQRHMTPQPPYRAMPNAMPYTDHNVGMVHAAPGQPPYGYGNQPPPFQSPTPVQMPQYRSTPPPLQPPAQDDFLTILQSTQMLISTLQAQFAANPSDQALITKLQALLQLQQILQTQGHALGLTDLQQIKSQITSLSAAAAIRVSTPMSSAPQLPTLASAPSPSPFYPVQPPAFMPPFQPPASTQTSIPPSIFAPGALDSLQALLSGNNKPSTPQLRTAVPALQNASHTQLSSMQNQVASAPQLNSNDLLAALARNNLLPAVPPPITSPPAQIPSMPPLPSTITNNNTSSAPVAASTEALLASIKQFLPPIPATTTPLASNNLATDTTTAPKIPLSAAALKVFRPELVRGLYDAQPNQCNNCGRRFLATEAGREKKARHLDWHFRTNQRMADASTNRGYHRNWFVDEVTWIRLTEFDPSTTTAEEAARLHATSSSGQSSGGTGGSRGVGGGSGHGAGYPSGHATDRKRVEEIFVRAPPGMTANTCSICYEDMQSSYNDELQDWVFVNAVSLGGNKIVHATCAEDIRRANPVAVSVSAPMTTHALTTTGTAPTAAANALSNSSLAAILSGLGNNNGVNRATRSRSGTPDSTLGKRKAATALAGSANARVKTE